MRDPHIIRHPSIADTFGTPTRRAAGRLRGPALRCVCSAVVVPGTITCRCACPRCGHHIDAHDETARCYHRDDTTDISCHCGWDPAPPRTPVHP